MPKQPFVVTLILLFLVPLAHSAELYQLQLDEAPGTPYWLYLTDERDELTARSIWAQQSRLEWQQPAEQPPNFGFDRRVHWFAAQVVSDQLSDTLLTIGYPPLDLVTVYLMDNHTGRIVQTYTVGDNFAFHSRPIETPQYALPLKLNPAHPYLLLIRVETSSSLVLPTRIWQPSDFWEKHQHAQLLNGLFQGLMWIMVFYYLILFWKLHDQAFFYFALTIGFFALTEASLTGLAFQYLWSGSPGWNQIAPLVMVTLSTFSLAMFVVHFMQLPSLSKRLTLLFHGLAALMLLGALGSLFLPYHFMANFVVAGVIVVPLTAYLISLFQSFKGHRTARIFASAFTIYVVCALPYVLAKYGYLPSNAFTEHALYFGSTLIVAILSFAIADRIIREQQQRQLAQQEAIDHLQKYEKLYTESLEGIFQCNLRGQALTANPALVQMLDARSAEHLMSLGNLLERLIPSADEREAFFRQLQDRSQIKDFESHAKTVNGNALWLSIYARLNDSAEHPEPIIEGSVIDIDKRKQSESILQFLAHHDPLTQLKNRAAFEKHLQEAFDSAAQGQEHALLFMDLDQFKVVNDTCGHGAGDELLRQLALMFRKRTRQQDKLARLGGDEFGVLLINCPLSRAERIAEELRNDVQDFRFIWQQQSFNLGVSIGVVPVTRDAESVEQIASLADTACYAAKDAGRNRVYVHSGQNSEVEMRRSEMRLVSDINLALKDDNFQLFSQPIAATRHGQDKGAHYEVLIRMEAGSSLLPPGAFLPSAERFNLIVALDRWVVDHFFAWLSQDESRQYQLHQATINLSGQSVSEPAFSSFVKQSFARYQIPPHKICFEITESMAISNLRDTLNFIGDMSALGVRFSLDDFGSGFSSYGYLRQLPIHSVKIDGSFIRDIVNDPISEVMVKSITEIAHTMQLDVIAEFVENQATFDKVESIGVNYVQGYHLGKPSSLTR